MGKKLLRLVVAISVLAVFAIGCAPKRNMGSPYPATDAQPPMYSHVVTYPGETLAMISLWYTGKTTNWQAIQNANPGLQPERIRLGQTILIPRVLMVKDEPLPRGFIRMPMKSDVTSDSTEKTGDANSNAPENAGAVAATAPTGTDAPAAAQPETKPAEAAPVVGAPAAPAPKNSTDQERDKLLDELLSE